MKFWNIKWCNVPWEQTHFARKVEKSELILDFENVISIDKKRTNGDPKNGFSRIPRIILCQNYSPFTSSPDFHKQIYHLCVSLSCNLTLELIRTCLNLRFKIIFKLNPAFHWGGGDTLRGLDGIVVGFTYLKNESCEEVETDDDWQ